MKKYVMVALIALAMFQNLVAMNFADRSGTQPASATKSDRAQDTVGKTSSVSVEIAIEAFVPAEELRRQARPAETPTKTAKTREAISPIFGGSPAAPV